MAEIEIEYCVPCGVLPMAERTQHALFDEFGRGVNDLRLRPGHGGVFKVSLNGGVIFDKPGEDFDPAEIVRRVGECIGLEPPQGRSRSATCSWMLSEHD